MLVWRPAPAGAPPRRGFGEAPGDSEDEEDPNAPHWKVRDHTHRIVYMPASTHCRVTTLKTCAFLKIQIQVNGALRGHSDDVMDVAWSPDGAALLSGCVRSSVHVFDVDSRRSVVSTRGCLCVCLGMGGLQEAANGCVRSSVHVFDVDSRRSVVGAGGGLCCKKRQ